MGAGCAETMAAIKLVFEPPSKARFPVAISYSTAPNEKMSVRASASVPSSCSGAMYWNVPRIVPWAVRGPAAGDWAVDRREEKPATPLIGGAAPAAVRARPKSSSLAPVRVSMMLPGFRSR